LGQAERGLHAEPRLGRGTRMAVEIHPAARRLCARVVPGAVRHAASIGHEDEMAMRRALLSARCRGWGLPRATGRAAASPVLARPFEAGCNGRGWLRSAIPA